MQRQEPATATSEVTVRSGGEVLVDQLVVHGVTDVFCVPGESFLAVLDALHDQSIRVTACRHEGGATFMAEAAGKLTGRPGIAIVSRGPGAMNASTGIHVAMQDSTPLILIVGQVPRAVRGREAFQEMDYGACFGSVAKWVIEIDDAARLPEMVSRAFHVATQGRPGPVVIAVPEDMLADGVEVRDAMPYETACAGISTEQVERIQSRLEAASNPILIAGGPGWTADAVSSLERFADRFTLSVAVTFRRQMLFSADHPCFAGDLGIGQNPKLTERVRNADLVMLVGGRLSDVPSQNYSLFDIPGTGERLIHIHPGSDELNKIYHARIAIQARPDTFCAAIEGMAPRCALPWLAETPKAHADYRAWSDCSSVRSPGELQMQSVVEVMLSRLPADTIVCNGAGNYAGWVHRFWRFTRFGTQLAPTCGCMGYGVPAAVAAKRLHPSKVVVAFAGDGCFMMNGQELVTAIQYELPILIVVVDNGMYGTIRLHQERKYPGRVVGTDLHSPDFAALARAYGGHGETVTRNAEFPDALERALASQKAAIIHCRISPEAITPGETLSGVRASALAARADRKSAG